LSRLYKVSADTSEKEKAVGGLVTFNQAGWLALGLLISGIIFLSTAKVIPPVVSIILALPPGAAFGGLFAFYTKEGLPLFTYLSYKRAFKKKSKQMVNDLIFEKTFTKDDELFL